MKRLFDVVLSALSLMVLSPIIGVTALMVWFNFGTPVFFRQWRPGLHGEPFLIVKFKTMLDEHDSRGRNLEDAERLTRFGRFLRASSLDELPELWNVLRGEMSIVGPRPLLMEYLPLYSKEQQRRHDVRPGMTGWAQVNGRNAISWEERFARDVWYVKNRSASLDAKILVLTLIQVLRRHGINAKGAATMPRFRGSESEEQGCRESHRVGGRRGHEQHG